MESSPWVRLAMAAGFYLLVIWGHLSLEGGTAFAVFYAFAMAAMLIYWSQQEVAESVVADSLLAEIGEYHDLEGLSAEDWRRMFDAEQVIDGVESHDYFSEPSENSDSLHASERESVQKALTRLDAIKSELKAQYAQLGKDQTAWRSGERWRFD